MLNLLKPRGKMQGYILHLQKVRDEDMIVKILTPSHIKTLYRFYGMRHSILSIGRKVDFEANEHLHFLPKMNHILHLSHKWENEYARLYSWQYMIKLLYKHLIDIYEIEKFYFDLLESSAHKIIAQNPKRVLLESYAKLLRFEGRVHNMNNDVCFVCEESLGDVVSLGRAFVFAHPHCIGGNTFEKGQIINFLQSTSTIRLSNENVNMLWDILGMGL